MRDRRAFLSGLVSLPLIGGGVTLIGKPTAAAVPATPDLLHGYKTWLRYEHNMLCHELTSYADPERARRLHGEFYLEHSAANWHFDWPMPEGSRHAGWPNAPQPSSRAAVVLAAAGVALGGGQCG